MDKNRIRKANIRFENGLSIKLLKTIIINILFGQINFYIIKTNIFFLLLFKDINRLKIYLNNIINQLIDKDKIIVNIIKK